MTLGEIIQCLRVVSTLWPLFTALAFCLGLLVGTAGGRIRRYDGRPDTRDWLADEGLDERGTAGDLGRGKAISTEHP